MTSLDQPGPAQTNKFLDWTITASNHTPANDQLRATNGQFEQLMTILARSSHVPHKATILNWIYHHGVLF